MSASSACSAAVGAPCVRGAANRYDWHDPAARSRLSAREVDAALRQALEDLQRAHQCSVLWFGEIARRKLHRELGYASIHQYATDALGFTANRINRYLKLVEDLDRLPRVRAALASGEIGWTKAREIVKVASPATEQRWIEAARRSSRCELEARVARARQCKRSARNANPQQAGLEAALVTGAGAERPVRAGNAGAVEAMKGSALALTAAAPDIFPPETDDLTDDAPAAVVLRLNPMQLARYEALIERVRKLRIGGHRVSREELHLMGLEQLVESAGHSRVREDAHRDGQRRRAEVSSSRATAVGHDAEVAAGDAENPDGKACDDGTVPRGTAPYRIVIYSCESCHRAMVQTSRGPKEIRQAQMAAASCDAIIERPGEKNESAIRPLVRQAALRRDRHRCQAPGCGSTRFLEVHHIVPREKGGSNRAGNLVTLCSRCHQFWHERGLRRLPGIHGHE